MTKKPRTIKTPEVPSAWPLRFSNGGVQVELNRDGSVQGDIEVFLDTLTDRSEGEAALAATCAWLVKRVEDLERSTVVLAAQINKERRVFEDMHALYAEDE